MTDTINKKILLAEDDPYISRAYVEGLKEAGFGIVRAFNGEQVLLNAKSEKPDLILLDLMMPEKDGFETLKELKADEVLKNIPVIILSNLSQDSDIEKTKALGAADYLVKSDNSIDQVVEKVNSHLK